MGRSYGRKMISLIVAASTNDVIGINGELPWRLSADLRRFKEITMGKPIVMGRKTYESIGRPLPGRQNIVITRQEGFVAQGCDVVGSPEAAIHAAGDADEIMIIGGSHIYAAFLPLAKRIYLTRVHADVEGDAFLPALELADWRKIRSEAMPAGATDDYAAEFMIFERND
jgi:dihydrofolate reductase